MITERGLFHAFHRTWCPYGRLGQGRQEGNADGGNQAKASTSCPRGLPWCPSELSFGITLSGLCARPERSSKDNQNFRGLGIMKGTEVQRVSISQSTSMGSMCWHRLRCGARCLPSPPTQAPLRPSGFPRFPELPLISPQGSPVPLGQVKPPGRLPSTVWEGSCPFYARPTWEADPCNFAGHYLARKRVAPSCQAVGGLFLPWSGKSSWAILVFNRSLMSDSLQCQGL